MRNRCFWFVFIGTLIDVVRSECNDTALDACKTPLSTKFMNYISFNYPVILMLPTSPSIRQDLCSTFNITELCVQSTAKCSSLDTPVIQKYRSINDSLSYVCGDGTAGFTAFQTCLTKSASYGTIVGSCANAQPFNHMDPCRQFVGRSNCFIIGAAIECNSARFVKTYMSKVLQDSYNDCNIGKSYCDQTNLTECIEPLNLGPDMNVVTSNIIYPDVSSFLGNLCKNLTTANTCIHSAGCTSADVEFEVLWSGIDNSTAYLCEDGQTGFRRYQQCLVANPNLMGNSEYVWNTTECTGYQKFYRTPGQHRCPTYNFYLRCYSAVAKIYCDSEEFVSTYLYKNLQPVCDAIGCPLSRNETTGIWNIVETTTLPSDTYYVKLTTQFKMKDKYFTSEFENLNSEASTNLSNAICNSFDEVLRNKTNKPMKLCSVLRYSQGSLVADTDLSFPTSTIGDLQKQVTDAVNADFANPSGTFKRNLNSDVASFQVSSASPDQPTTSPPDYGTNTGAIVGGTIGGVALITVVIGAIIYKTTSAGSSTGAASESVSRSRSSSLGSSPPGSIRVDEESFDGSCKATGQGFVTRLNVTNWPFMYAYNSGNAGRFVYVKYKV